MEQETKSALIVGASIVVVGIVFVLFHNKNVSNSDEIEAGVSSEELTPIVAKGMVSLGTENSDYAELLSQLAGTNDSQTSTPAPDTSSTTPSTTTAPAPVVDSSYQVSAYDGMALSRTIRKNIDASVTSATLQY